MSEVRSSLGLVSGPNLLFPIFAEPLKALMRRGAKFEWNEAWEKALAVAFVLVLAYFDKTAHTRVVADATPIGAVLVREVGRGGGRAEPCGVVCQ